MNTVLIPCWRRPEMLWHCLANIKRAHGSDAYHYIFRMDKGYDPALHEVIEGFPFSYQISEAGPTKYREISKQSHNLLHDPLQGQPRKSPPHPLDVPEHHQIEVRPVQECGEVSRRLGRHQRAVMCFWS